MPEKPKPEANTQNQSASEARHLAEEAMEEIRHGNKEEGKFVLGEARKLDPKAADQVAQEKKPPGR